MTTTRRAQRARQAASAAARTQRHRMRTVSHARTANISPSLGPRSASRVPRVPPVTIALAARDRVPESALRAQLAHSKPEQAPHGTQRAPRALRASSSRHRDRRHAARARRATQVATAPDAAHRAVGPAQAVPLVSSRVAAAFGLACVPTVPPATMRKRRGRLRATPAHGANFRHAQVRPRVSHAKRALRACTA